MQNSVEKQENLENHRKYQNIKFRKIETNAEQFRKSKQCENHRDRDNGSNNDNVYSVNENNDICMYECVRVAVVAVEVVEVGRYVGSTLSH